MAAPKRPKRLPRETWKRLRERAEAGEILKDLAVEFGIPYTTICKRSVVEKWQTPGRRESQRRHNGTTTNQGDAARNASNLQQADPDTNASNLQQEVPALDQLMSAIESGNTEDMQSAIATLGKGMLRRGFEEMPLPRTAGEFSTWYEIVRKSLGIDGKGSGQKGSSLRVPRSIGRPTIKRAEPPAANPPNPPAGFDLGPEPDPPGFIL